MRGDRDRLAWALDVEGWAKSSASSTLSVVVVGEEEEILNLRFSFVSLLMLVLDLRRFRFNIFGGDAGAMATSTPSTTSFFTT